ncbi:MAG: hypothetical protein L0332_11865 [Chloroflexi bacterium]|nr:hypothetical protein [Chloroflexota bacterium]
MTFKARHTVAYVLLVVLLLAVLVVPAFAATSRVVTNEPYKVALFEGHEAGTGPGIAIACNCPDPGGSGGGCC